MLFKKEKQVAELIKQHVGATNDCVLKARELLETYVTGNASATQSLAQEVNDLESRGDAIKREIRDVLFSGAYLPAIRGDIYQLVDKLDKVAGTAEEASDYLVCQTLDIPEEFQSELVEMWSISVAAVYELSRAVKTFLKPKGKFEKLLERSSRVGLMESEVDDHEAKLVQEIFDSELDLSRKIHLAGYVTLVATIADKTEDGADQLIFASLKSAI